MDEETAQPPKWWLHIATNSAATKRKRRLAGTPDPDAEVVSLSPRALLEWKEYVCEICNKVFRRDQNLQMHGRLHKLPWKALKRNAGEPARPRKKRVFVCPEPSCLYHDPSRALGDLVGSKTHFRRKHSGHRQWACSRCSKAYAVHTDYKAHVKTCGTRAGHSTCRCGRVFTRLDSFMEHRDTCSAGRPQVGVGADVSSAPVCGAAAAAAASPLQQQAPTARSPCRSSPSSDIVMGAVAVRSTAAPAFHRFLDQGPTPPSGTPGGGPHNLELQLMPPSCYAAAAHSPQAPISRADDDVTTELRLSISFSM